MRQTRCKWIWLLLLISLPAAAMEPPAAFEANYNLKKYSSTVARMTISLEHQDSELRYHSTTEPVGFMAIFSRDRITESSQLLWSTLQSQPRLLNYRLHRKNKADKNQHININWDDDSNSTIQAQYGTQQFQIKHKGPLWDRFSVQLALWASLQTVTQLSPGTIFSYDIIDRGAINHYRFEYVSSEMVKLDAGSYHSLKFLRHHGSRKTYLWLATELDHFLIKSEQYKKDDLIMSMELDHYTQK